MLTEGDRDIVPSPAIPTTPASSEVATSKKSTVASLWSSSSSHPTPPLVMEVDEIQRQVSKFQRVSSNGSTTNTVNSSNPQMIATNRGNFELQNHVHNGGGGGGGGVDDVGGGGGVGDVARLCGWPLSHIIRVFRVSRRNVSHPAFRIH
ncbi:hypothetical protein L1987_46157 [Smallanthus sonchifolius]|uniref:Uncharacterized protein n=1 Tax=Smallanthus sonchifolius TaxID=185202 RepID=A0ACB9FYT6_9ASTR|nr:hypothetical protein L1987_46157 [Smallanthus sonchifolius]